jgi:hypothetical protein
MARAGRAAEAVQEAQVIITAAPRALAIQLAIEVSHLSILRPFNVCEKFSNGLSLTSSLPLYTFPKLAAKTSKPRNFKNITFYTLQTTMSTMPTTTRKS